MAEQISSPIDLSLKKKISCSNQDFPLDLSFKPDERRNPTRKSSNKNERKPKGKIFECCCGEKFSKISFLVRHLKSTGHKNEILTSKLNLGKLVRGQEVWLSPETNPSTKILKCLRCSTSFESLNDLTAHFIRTNHLTSFQRPLLSRFGSTNQRETRQLIEDLLDRVERNLFNEKSSSQHNPLTSLERMLDRSSTVTTTNEKFEKYRIFAEKMIRTNKRS